MKIELLTPVCALVCTFIMIVVQLLGSSELRGMDGFYTYALFYLMFKK